MSKTNKLTKQRLNQTTKSCTCILFNVLRLKVCVVHIHFYLLTSKNPLEVSEEFIRNYNSSQTLDDRDKYEVTAYKMLERAKVNVN